LERFQERSNLSNYKDAEACTAEYETRLCSKTEDTKLTVISLAILNQFSKFFHRKTKFAVSPETRRYTTLQNIKIGKQATISDVVINDKKPS